MHVNKVFAHAAPARRAPTNPRDLLSHVNESDDELELTGIMNGGSGGGSGGTAPKDASSSSLEMEKVSTQGPTAPLDGEIDNLDSTVVSASTSGEVERREKLSQLAAQRQAMDAEIARAAAHTEAEVVLQEPSADSSGGGGVETGDGNGAPRPAAAAAAAAAAMTRKRIWGEPRTRRRRRRRRRSR